MDLLLNTARQSFWWCFGAVEYAIWADWLLCGWIHVPTSVVPPVFLSLFLGVMSMRVRPCMYVLACVWVNPGPPAHFTRRQTSKAFWINPACRGRSACHPQFHISAAPAAPNLDAHSYWNEQMEFCHAANRHPSLRKDKTSKERRYIGICFSRWWGCVSSQVEWRCSVSLWKCGQSASIVFFLIKAGQLCLHYSSLAKAGSLSPWLDTAEMMSWSRAHTHTHTLTDTRTGTNIKAVLTSFNSFHKSITGSLSPHRDVCLCPKCVFWLFRLDSVTSAFASKHLFSHFHLILAANLILYCIYWSGRLQFPAAAWFRRAMKAIM